jgi:4-oxalocrotonate tautomerase family enzyme
MPVAHVHVVGSSPEQRREIGAEVTRIYAEVLEAPLERIRVFVMEHAPGDVTVAGVNVGEGGDPAPFFTAIVFESRPVEQRHRLLREVSELLARVMEVDIAGVRGQVVPVAPDDWGIAGVPAAVARSGEIAARLAAQ